MTDLTQLKFFLTSPHECGYLHDEQACNVFVDPSAELNISVYEQLTDLGFRRSGNYLYRPNCAHCHACIPIRLSVDEFVPNRNQRRCLKRNADLHCEITRDISGDEYYSLFERYIEDRHYDGEMYPASRETFANFLGQAFDTTHYQVVRDADGKLLSVAVTDVLGHALSAIYTFFDPDEEKRSLGVYNIVKQIEWAKRFQRPYLYLGYWISRCAKMSYKTQYQPYEILLGRHWKKYQNRQR